MYVNALTNTYRDHATLVALCDTSMTRMKYHANRIIEGHKHSPVPMYLADKFEQMVKEAKPDVVIVTTVDCFHDVYITRAMELGCDAITEKPMTTDADKAKKIFDAIDKTGRQLRVTHNYRYSTYATAVREQIMKGAIG